MPVLNGFQGQKKSSLIRRLCGEWYNDDVSLSDTKDKTAAEKLQGSWIIEISELSGMRAVDVETLKASYQGRTTSTEPLTESVRARTRGNVSL